MILNLAKFNTDTVLLTNTDEAFVGTTIAESPFSIKIKRLSRVEKIDTMSEALGEDGKISNGRYSRALFINSIAEVDGFVDENGDAITEGIREIIWEIAPDALVGKIKEVIEGFNSSEEKKSE